MYENGKSILLELNCSFYRLWSFRRNDFRTTRKAESWNLSVLANLSKRPHNWYNTWVKLRYTNLPSFHWLQLENVVFFVLALEAHNRGHLGYGSCAGSKRWFKKLCFQNAGHRWWGQRTTLKTILLGFPQGLFLAYRLSWQVSLLPVCGCLKEAKTAASDHPLLYSYIFEETNASLD